MRSLWVEAALGTSGLAVIYWDQVQLGDIHRVLGMLGITSLGFWVRETRARDWYDEMLLFILLGAVLVLIVDLASALTRRYLRRV